MSAVFCDRLRKTPEVVEKHQIFLGKLGFGNRKTQKLSYGSMLFRKLANSFECIFCDRLGTLARGEEKVASPAKS